MQKIVFLLLTILIVLPNSAFPSTSYLQIDEDTTWRGTVLLSSSVVVSSQATLRIEPGSVIKFSKKGESFPKIVIMGRIAAKGEKNAPIRFISENEMWGGILFLSSSKNNRLEYTEISSADVGVEAKYSNLSLLAVEIKNSNHALNFADSVIEADNLSLKSNGTAISSVATELDMKNSNLINNKISGYITSSSLQLYNTKFEKSSEAGLYLNKTRFKITKSEFSDSKYGIKIVSCDGEATFSKFIKNIVFGLSLKDSGAKISKCTIASNEETGIEISDNRSAIWWNDISDNKKYNLRYDGKYEKISLQLNWWGGNDIDSLYSKFVDVNGRDIKTILNIAPILQNSIIR